MRIALFTALLAAGGCVRDAEERRCPDVSVGDLVVTEIAGPQDAIENFVPWFEIMNLSGRILDLEGLRFRLRRLDGSEAGTFIIRRTVNSLPGFGVTLGYVSDETKPQYVDYGFLADYHGSVLTSGALDVSSCDVLLDRVLFESLPDVGSFSLGTRPPTPEANDNPLEWCTDDEDVAIIVGSPGLPNGECPSEDDDQP